MNLICILPILYNQKSNGIVTLCSIYKELQRKTSLQIFFVCKITQNSPTLRHYQEIFGENLIMYESNLQQRLVEKIAKDKFVLIRPDDLEGIRNEIHWTLSKSKQLHCIVNILLAPPFTFSRNISILRYYGEKDLFLICNQSIMPAFEGMDGYNLYLESPLNPSIWKFINRGSEKRTRISVFIGKGIIRPLSKWQGESGNAIRRILDSGDLLFIKRNWPREKVELYSILSETKLLISFDPFSHIEREATILGTPVIKMYKFNLRELPGVFTMDQIMLANLDYKDTKEQAFADYIDSISSNENTLLTLTLSILSITKLDDIRNAKKPLLPFSEHLLFSFSSQLRGLQHIIGATTMDRENKMLNSDDLLEILKLTPGEAASNLQKNAYISKLNITRPGLLSYSYYNNNRTYYQFLR